MVTHYHAQEYQKANCHEKIAFHTKNVALQSVVSFLCIVAGLYAAQRQSVLVPFILAPSAALSLSKLSNHAASRRHYKNQLKQLERN